ncbi:MAG: ABC transporter ATP-binding protein, partial [Phycisphaerales bacterium]
VCSSDLQRKRVALARTLVTETDLLILDEPTNDLDLATLEVLEESIEDFPGAVVLVTHDRAMLDRLATSVLALDGGGGARYFADYPQWERVTQSGSLPLTQPDSSPPEPMPRVARSAAPVLKQQKKLGYKEQRELDGMENAIEEAESDLARLEAEMGSPAVLADHARLADLGRAMAAAQQRVQTLYARWQELEERAAGA